MDTGSLIGIGCITPHKSYGSIEYLAGNYRELYVV